MRLTTLVGSVLWDDINITADHTNQVDSDIHLLLEREHGQWFYTERGKKPGKETLRAC